METTASTPVANLKKDWWIYLLSGIAAFVIGWMLLSQPALTTANLVIFLGFYWLVSGIIDMIFAVANRKEKEHTGLKIAGGFLSLFAGLIIINNPIFSVVFTPVMFMYLVAFTFIVNGIIKIFTGNEHMNENGEFYKKVSIGSVLLGLLLAFTGLWLLLSPTIVSVATLVMATGLYLTAYGIAMVILGFYIRFSKES